MRYLVLSDIHANLQALAAVLEAAPARDYDAVICLGDLVGYGGDPNAVVDRVRDLKPVAIVRGNHDKVALGIDQADGFNYVAKEAAEWTLSALTAANRKYLAGLPQGPVIVDDLLQICHGAPQDEDAYVFDVAEAAEAIDAGERRLLLCGHTHAQAVFKRTAKDIQALEVTREIEMDKRSRYLVNPGSIGQPRDSDTRAAYAIVDTDNCSVRMLRAAYRIDEARARINAAGLPDSLAHRLELGR